MEGDKLFHYTGYCSQGCGYGHIYILAENQDNANNLKEIGCGLCGDCVCGNIIDTHGMIITDPETTEFPILLFSN